MAHPAQQRWCETIKAKFPEYFKNKTILDIGSLGINGNNRSLFKDCIYHGLDVIEGKNVDIVSVAHEYTPNIQYDVVMSTNALEHDIHFKKTIPHMYNLTKSGGLLFFQACTSRPEHGTLRTSPSQSATSQMNEDWANYYHNIQVEDLEPLVKDMQFKKHHISTAKMDIFFWGIKK